jgi:hypothetical protein
MDIAELAHRLHDHANRSSLGVLDEVAKLTPETAGQVLAFLHRGFGDALSPVLRAHLQDRMRDGSPVLK